MRMSETTIVPMKTFVLCRERLYGVGERRRFLFQKLRWRNVVKLFANVWRHITYGRPN